MSEIVQRRPDELIDILRADFQPRYEPNFAWKSACSQFLALTGLRGFWPTSSFNESAEAFDLSGQGRTLTTDQDGEPEYSYSNLIPYVEFNKDTEGGGHLRRADEAGLDIIGTESYVKGAVRGLTIGGWFFFSTLAAGNDPGIIGKWDDLGGANQRSYLIIFADAGNTPNFLISTDGTAIVTATGPALSVATWYFLVGRFEPSTAVRIFVNGTWYSTVAGIPATIFNSTANFAIGTKHNSFASTWDEGRASMCFLCTAALSDSIVGALFHQTRAMFQI